MLQDRALLYGCRLCHIEATQRDNRMGQIKVEVSNFIWRRDKFRLFVPFDLSHGGHSKARARDFRVELEGVKSSQNMTYLFILIAVIWISRGVFRNFQNTTSQIFDNKKQSCDLVSRFIQAYWNLSRSYWCLRVNDISCCV